MPHNHAHTTHTRTAHGIVRLKRDWDAFNAHKLTCVDVSRIRLRLSVERNHFIVIASDLFCLSTQHHVFLHYTAISRKTCACVQCRVRVHWHWYTGRRYTNHLQWICIAAIGILTVIRVPLAYNAILYSILSKWRRRKMFPFTCGVSAATKGSAALSQFRTYRTIPKAHTQQQTNANAAPK